MKDFKNINLVQWKIDELVDKALDATSDKDNDSSDLRNKVRKGVKIARVASLGIGSFIPGLNLVNGAAYISDGSKSKIIKDQQYQILIRDFVIEGLKVFMGDE